MGDPRTRVYLENERLKALLSHSKTQLEYDELQAENEKARLFRLEVQEAVEALIGCEDDKALRILEQALKDKDNG